MFVLGFGRRRNVDVPAPKKAAPPTRRLTYDERDDVFRTLRKNRLFEVFFLMDAHGLRGAGPSAST